MTNQELVNNIVCNNCRVKINSGRKCTPFNTVECFIYNSALQVANEKDKQYQEEYIQHFSND